jgi:hypothetical protein
VVVALHRVSMAQESVVESLMIYKIRQIRCGHRADCPSRLLSNRDRRSRGRGPPHGLGTRLGAVDQFATWRRLDRELPQIGRDSGHDKVDPPAAAADEVSSMAVLIRFPHGLRGAVDLTCVLQHLTKHHPNWTVDVATTIGKHSAYSGLCRRSLILDCDYIDVTQYDMVYDLDWRECLRIYHDSPCTKACNCLHEVFGIAPELALLKYRIGVTEFSRLLTRHYLRGICGSPAKSDRFPVVAIHYESTTSGAQKNLSHELVADLCRRILRRGYTPLILDWDRRSPLPDQKSIFCPGVGPGDLWDNSGTGDAERLAALLAQCALVIGVNSGPLHVAGATDTPTLGVWTGRHPVQFYDLCPNVTHLVPQKWQELSPCQNQAAAEFFAEHYAFRTYDDLAPTLISNMLELLESSGVTH